LSPERANRLVIGKVLAEARGGIGHREARIFVAFRSTRAPWRTSRIHCLASIPLDTSDVSALILFAVVNSSLVYKQKQKWLKVKSIYEYCKNAKLNVRFFGVIIVT
jgi:hypothetical protein